MRYKLVKMEINVDNINWPYSGGIHNIVMSEIKENLENIFFFDNPYILSRTSFIAFIRKFYIPEGMRLSIKC